MQFKTFRVQASRQVLTLLAIGTLLPSAVLAQVPDMPSFSPAGVWTVGSTELSNVRGLSNMKLPCVVSNEFDNGYVMRLSGGGGKFLAMAIDFRQDVFKQGRKYSAMLSIGDGYAKQVTATAFTSNTLIFNLRPLPDFYTTVKSGRTMELDIENNVMSFTLDNLSSAFPGLEACYAGEGAPVINPMIDTRTRVADVEQQPLSDGPAASQPQPLLPQAVAQKPMPKTMDDIVQGSERDMTPLPAGPSGMTVAQTTPRAPDPVLGAGRVSRAGNVAEKPSAIPQKMMPMTSSAQSSQAWNAKAGEDMKIVLSRWAERAGYDLEWQADQDSRVAQDIALNGSFEEAVSQLLAENSAASGIGGHVQTLDGGRKVLTPPARPAMASREKAPVVPPFHADWAASAGANIQTVIDEWSHKAGVTVVWQDYMSVPVKSTVSMSGSYESALQSLLDQFSGDSTRPVAQLNIDPESGQRTLLMNIDKSS